MRRAEVANGALGAELATGSGGAASPTGDTLVAPLRAGRGSCPRPITFVQHVKRAAFSHSPLLRSTAFRYAISFWLLFAACATFAGYSFYETVQMSASNKIAGSLEERTDAIRAVYDAQGPDGLVELDIVHANEPMGMGVGVFMTAPNGERLIGNLPSGLSQTGWATMPGTQVGLAGDTGHYRFLTTMIGNNRLTVGRSLMVLEELRTIAVNCLLSAFVVSMLLSIVAAYWIMRRSRARMQGFGDALNRLADGNLSVRVPVSTAGDDIDAMALTVNAAFERLQGNIDSLRQVSTDIAHDLKTPLNRLYIQLDDALNCAMDLDAAQGEPIVASLDEALLEAQHINSTFEALLRVAQIEAGARRANFKHFDLAETLATACEIYAPVVEEACAGLDVRFDTTRALPMFGDRELVLQLAVNLIENAIRHGCTGDDASEVVIAVEAGGQDDQVWLSVVDSGPGIPLDERDRVFQRLYRLERSRTTRGTGLGLNLVKAIAELHCGSLLLADGDAGTSGPGLRFTVEFDRNCPIEQARAATR